jgi:hypothetical protein
MSAMIRVISYSILENMLLPLAKAAVVITKSGLLQ